MKIIRYVLVYLLKSIFLFAIFQETNFQKFHLQAYKKLWQGYLNNYEFALTTINAEGSGIRVGNNKPETKGLKIIFNSENVTSEASKILTEKFSNIIEAVDKMDNILNKTMYGHFWNATGFMGFETSVVLANTIKFQIGDDFAILNNPIFFKGKWKYQFSEPETKTLMTFHVDSSTQTRCVPVKLTENLKLANVKELKADVLELPYQNQQISMIIVLPKNISDIHQVEKNLKDLDVRSLAQKLNSIHTSKIEVTMPTLSKFVNPPDPIDLLESLGVESLFSNINISNSANEPLYVSEMGHHGYVMVNDENSFLGAPRADLSPAFVIDRPFLFYIYDHVNQITLFVGRIVDPLYGNAKLQPDKTFGELPQPE